jgi:hypothetical protein
MSRRATYHQVASSFSSNGARSLLLQDFFITPGRFRPVQKHIGFLVVVVYKVDAGTIRQEKDGRIDVVKDMFVQKLQMLDLFFVNHVLGGGILLQDFGS